MPDLGQDDRVRALESRIATLEDLLRTMEQAVVEQSERLEESSRDQSRLAAIVQDSDAAIITLAPDFKVSTWNRGAEWLFGYPQAEALGRSPADLFAVEPEKAFSEFSRDIALLEEAPHQPRYFERALRRKDGTQFEGSFIASGIYDYTGRLTGVSLIIRDISEQKQRERELNRVAALVEFSEDAITSISPDLLITGWNRSAERLFGVAAKDVIGKPFVTTVAPPLREQIARNMREDFEILRTKRDLVRHLEITIPRPDGSLADLSLVVSGIFDDRGELIGMSQIFRDITGRKRAEQEQALLASIVESSEDGIVSFSTDLRVTSWNKGAEKLLGFTASEALGREMFDLHIPPELREHAEQLVREDLEALRRRPGQVVRRIEVPARRKDGSTVEISIVVSGIFDRSGNLIGMSNIMRDMTERKNAEREQALLASIVSSMEDAVVSVGADGRVTSWNRGAENLLGFSAREAIGQTIGFYLPMESREFAEAQVRRQMEDAPEHRLLERLETRLQRKDGTTFDAYIVSSGIYDFAGNVIGLAGIIRDVSEAKRADRERSLLAAIVESSHDAIVGTSLDNQIVSWNSGAEEMFKTPAHQAIGRSVLDFVAPEDHPHVARTIAEVLESGEPRDFRLHSRRSDGSIFDSWVNMFPTRDKSGKITSIAAIGRDITELVRLEREQALLAGVVNASGDHIIGLTREGTITSWNPAAERDFGIPASKAIGSPMDIFVPPEELARVREIHERVARTGNPETFESLTPRKDGGRSTMFVNVFPIRDANGEIVGMAGIARDIGRLKQVEKELRETHEYTRGLIESSLDAIVVVDGEMRIIDGNEQLAKLTEMPKKVLVGTVFDSFFADSSAAREAVNRVFASGFVSNAELTLVSASGREIPISFNASLFYREGKVFGIVGVARDVTQQRETEKVLREEREYSRSLVQSSPDGLLVCDSDLVLTDVNDQALALTGYSRDELIGIKLPSLFAEPTEASDLLKKTREQGRVHDAELRLLTRRAAEVPVSLNTSAFQKGDGQGWQIVAAIRDISERKRAERERSLLASIVDSSGDAIYSETAELVITSWNPAAEKLFGYSGREIIGKSAALLAPLNERAEMVRRSHQVFSSGKAEHFETRRVRKDGSSFEAVITQSPIFDASGKVVALSITAQDISDRKRMEAELEQVRDAALEAARLKSEFLANMSHEIRTPLNSIIGLTGLLLDTELTDEQRDYARDVRDSGNALLNLVNDILDFSKIAAGKLVLEDATFNLNDAVETAVELVADQARRKNLEVIVAIDPDVPRALRGDPGRLRQVLLNLLANAVKFTEHGEVGVSVNKLSETPQEAMLRFEVRDTGIGIPKEKQHLLFQTFTQVDASTTRHYGGTGLGLSIARDIVKAMKGTISVSSSPGVGSVFWFTLKFGKQVDPSKPASERFASMLGTKVLIVDDNPNSRQILQLQVSSWGMSPTTADSAEQALSILRSPAGETFELALFDVMMPDVDGIELARRIQADPKLPKPTIIFVSSVGSRADFRARLAGVSVAEWLMKPVPESVLYDSITRVLARNAAPSRASERKKSSAPGAPNQPRFRLPGDSRMRALLAEDNPINQKVARLQLGKIGIEVDVVSNGREAVQALALRPYDVIFMDCQMPVMDGYDATREIRRREGKERHTPIIAMTAHALPGDREKCIESGMDGYISKPVTQEALETALAEMFPQEVLDASDGSEAKAPRDRSNGRGDSHEQPQSTAAMTGNAPRKPLEELCDRAAIENFRREGEGLLGELVALFDSEVAKGIEELTQALGAGDSETVARIAHTLKGSAGTFGAKKMFELAAAIDQAARVKALDKVSAMLPEFRIECDQVREALRNEAGS